MRVQSNLNETSKLDAEDYEFLFVIDNIDLEFSSLNLLQTKTNSVEEINSSRRNVIL